MYGKLTMYKQIILKGIQRKLPHKNKNFELYLKKFSDKRKRKIILLDTPTNGNIGDQAITFSTIRYLKEIFKNFSIIEVPYSDLNIVVGKLGKLLDPKRDLIVWNGGGNIGTIYPSAELSRWFVFRKLKKFNIIIFPQSIYYHDNKFGKYFLRKSEKKYSEKNNLVLFLREQKSFDFAKMNFNDTKIELTPDILFSLENKLPPTIHNSSRRDIVTILRNDVEKRDFDIDFILDYLKMKNEKIENSETFIPNLNIDFNNREKEIYKKLKEISQYKLVITDRLHGMIFAYLTKTPVIVVENNNWKIKSTYDTWLKDCNFVKMASNLRLDDLEILLNCSPEYVGVSKRLSNLNNRLEFLNE